jgi:hypothetical protein
MGSMQTVFEQLIADISYACKVLILKEYQVKKSVSIFIFKSIFLTMHFDSLSLNTLLPGIRKIGKIGLIVTRFARLCQFDQTRLIQLL